MRSTPHGHSAFPGDMTPSLHRSTSGWERARPPHQQLPHHSRKHRPPAHQLPQVSEAGGIVAHTLEIYFPRQILERAGSLGAGGGKQKRGPTQSKCHHDGADTDSQNEQQPRPHLQ